MTKKTGNAKSPGLREKHPPVDDPRQALAEGDPLETGRGTGGRMLDKPKAGSGTKPSAARSRPRKGQ